MNTWDNSHQQSDVRGFAWTGRTDGEGPEHARWHTVITSHEAGSAPAGGIALVGFGSDEGVRRNHGRIGAAAGPDSIRAALANLAVDASAQLTDAGTVVVHGRDLERAHAHLGEVVAQLLDRHDLVVVLGGGHETAWGSYLGRTRCARLAAARVGVINLDAHFDLRELGPTGATSGTPFRQMAQADAQAGRVFGDTVIGISAAANTAALFETARALGVHWFEDVECAFGLPPDLLDHLDQVVARSDAIHLSIDLDVLPAAVAPGVSAPAGYGVPLPVIEQVVRQVMRSGKVAVVDIAELNPAYDIDNRTARVAARLIHTVQTVQHEHSRPR